MKIGQKIECQSCGASSLIKHQNKLLLECEYCGAIMTFSEQRTSSLESKTQTINPVDKLPKKPLNLGVLLVLIPIVVIILMVVFWLVFQNIRKHRTIESYIKDPDEQLQIDPVNKATANNKAILKSKELNSNKSSELQVHLPEILSQVSGTTSQGGQYWILGIQNNSESTLSRPGVMLSLFNEQGKRIEEQGGWSLREMLEPGEKSVVLVYVNEVPIESHKHELNAFSSQSKLYGSEQVEINVTDFSVAKKNKSFELIGDVVNNHDFAVKYVRLMAVAYDINGKPIGTGNAFSSVKDLAPNQSSGFKVKVGTFLQGEPDTWRVWALGRQ